MTVSKARFESLATKFLDDTFKEFRKSFDIVEIVETADSQGGFTKTDTAFATVDGFIFPATGKEKEDSGRLITDQMFKFNFKPVPGFNTKMKIVYLGDDYQVRSIDNLVESDIWLVVMAEKGVAQ